MLFVCIFFIFVFRLSVRMVAFFHDQTVCTKMYILCVHSIKNCNSVFLCFVVGEMRVQVSVLPWLVFILCVSVEHSFLLPCVLYSWSPCLCLSVCVSVCLSVSLHACAHPLSHTDTHTHIHKHTHTHTHTHTYIYFQMRFA